MTGMDAKFWVDLAQFAVTLLVGLYVWISNRHRATRGQIEKVRDEHEARLQNHSNRVTSIEEQLRHMPDGKTIQDLTKQLQELHGDFKALNARFEGFKDVAKIMRRQVELMDEYLKRSG